MLYYNKCTELKSLAAEIITKLTSLNSIDLQKNKLIENAKMQKVRIKEELQDMVSKSKSTTKPKKLNENKYSTLEHNLNNIDTNLTKKLSELNITLNSLNEDIATIKLKVPTLSSSTEVFYTNYISMLKVFNNYINYIQEAKFTTDLTFDEKERLLILRENVLNLEKFYTVSNLHKSILVEINSILNSSFNTLKVKDKLSNSNKNSNVRLSPNNIQKRKFSTSLNRHKLNPFVVDTLVYKKLLELISEAKIYPYMGGRSLNTLQLEIEEFLYNQGKEILNVNLQKEMDLNPTLVSNLLIKEIIKHVDDINKLITNLRINVHNSKFHSLKETIYNDPK
jgi:hypothetical protein